MRSPERRTDSFLLVGLEPSRSFCGSGSADSYRRERHITKGSHRLWILLASALTLVVAGTYTLGVIPEGKKNTLNAKSKEWPLRLLPLSRPAK
ncbi:hypothetical protein AVEN_54652-1 [Araneus ventricosus]|uniref:Uncharacterized protein n=1 Tax=Araneus ventricosus TaxID=182803 RepID=A0A4Y2BN43_ARAVE|nr:hypothetical protein AVEN_54652-1 [Araneus ventricosus]